MIIIEAAIVLGAALFTMLVGSPIAAKLARVHVFGRYAPSEAGSASTAIDYHSAFEPIDMGEYPVKWPSEDPHDDAAYVIPEPKWPSELWDDPHFGKAFKREAVEQMAGSAGEAAFFGGGQTQQAKPASTKKRRKKKKKPQAQANQVRQRVREQAEQVREQVVDAVKSRAPSRDEVEAMVSNVGLAGTVQEIMNRTGWDFRQAAAYLAKIRNS